MAYDNPSDGFTQLIQVLTQLRRTAWSVTDSSGSGAHGEAIENALGIRRNNDKGSDYQGVELKTTTESKPKIRDLFTESPAQKIEHFTPISRKNLITAAGYTDGGGRQALKVAVSTTPNAQNLALQIEGEWIVETHNGTRVAAWHLRTLQNRLATKHGETCWLKCETRPHGVNHLILPIGYIRTANPDVDGLVEHIKAGRVTVEHRCHIDEKGSVRDHGDQWRYDGSIDGMFKSQGNYTPLVAPNEPYPSVIKGALYVPQIGHISHQLELNLWASRADSPCIGHN
jgi:hypothetical protein